MAARDSYTPGTPCWVDLGVPDIDATIAFYEALFGWKVPEPDDGGAYRVALLRGRPVAGFGSSGAGADTWWTTYVSVDDCDETATKVTAAGGTVAVEPNDLPGAGRIAVCADPLGAPFTLWQPREHIGALLVNEPGALCWNERETRQLDGVTSFYADVFNWRAETFRGSDDDCVFFLGDAAVASATRTSEGAETWAVYFQVEDCDAAVAKVAELGGKSLGDAHDSPDIGRMAEVADPEGAVFYVLSAPATAPG